jgi:hypothetical protein
MLRHKMHEAFIKEATQKYGVFLHYANFFYSLCKKCKKNCAVVDTNTLNQILRFLAQGEDFTNSHAEPVEAFE